MLLTSLPAVSATVYFYFSFDYDDYYEDDVTTRRHQVLLRRVDSDSDDDDYRCYDQTKQGC